MNNIEFLNSIKNIHYPDIVAAFFDHFIALKYIINDKGKMNIINHNDGSVTLNILFDDKADCVNTINTINSINNRIAIYNRLINIDINILTDNELNIILIDNNINNVVV